MTQILQLAMKHFIAANIKIINDLKENILLITGKFPLVCICFSNYKKLLFILGLSIRESNLKRY